MKIPSLNILRVYSDRVEQREFPIPNKLKPARTTRSDDELKISNENIRSVCLHHVIRNPACPYEKELRQFEEGFTQDKARGEIISQSDVGEYIKVSELAFKGMDHYYNLPTFNFENTNNKTFGRISTSNTCR